jgi:Cytochrome bd-type quinol oxidase, subunit 2
MMPALDLVPIWTTILAIGVFFYVALDGFDLGVGMLYIIAPDRRSRDLLMNSIAPIWDGNETWLIRGGRRFAGRVSGRVCDHHSSGVFPDPADAARIDLSRAGV